MTSARLISPSLLTGACLLVIYAYGCFLLVWTATNRLAFTDDFHGAIFFWLWGLSFLGLLVWDKIFCRTHRSLSLVIKIVFLASLILLFLPLLPAALT